LDLVLRYAVQFVDARSHPGPANLLAPFLLVAFFVCVGALAGPLLGVAVSGVKGRVRAWRGRRRQARFAATAERRARALMGELCPHGWQAQVTLFGAVDDVDRPVAPGGGPAQVALDWAELQDSCGPPVVMRRVWAPTIGEALDAMVADRRTDQTLEQIEQGAVADGTLWPDHP
jgi:hypothetical protein